ncbi:hypothetical protein NN561_018857 [Cricetulus griseus]
MPAWSGRVRSRGHPPDCGRRAPSRPASPIARRPPLSLAVCPPQRRAPSAAAQPSAAPRAPGRPLTHAGGSGGVSIVAPRGLQNAGTVRRRQHHSSRGRRHCPPAQSRSISPEGAQHSSPRATTCGGGPRGHGPSAPRAPVPGATPALPRVRGGGGDGDGCGGGGGGTGERAARPLPGSPSRRRRRDGRALRPPAAEGPLPRRRPFLRGVWRRRRRRASAGRDPGPRLEDGRRGGFVWKGARLCTACSDSRACSRPPLCVGVPSPGQAKHCPSKGGNRGKQKRDRPGQCPKPEAS